MRLCALLRDTIPPFAAAAAAAATPRFFCRHASRYDTFSPTLYIAATISESYL